MEINIDGNLVDHQEISITPLNHFLLRICSHLFGNIIINFLKKKFIYKKGLINSNFFRKIKIYEDRIIVRDKIKNKNFGNLTRAPRTSKRHVSSSDSFHKEDFIYNNFYTDKKYITDTEKEITTKYPLVEKQ